MNIMLPAFILDHLLIKLQNIFLSNAFVQALS